MDFTGLLLLAPMAVFALCVMVTPRDAGSRFRRWVASWTEPPAPPLSTERIER